MLLFFEKFVLAVLAGFALLVLGTNPLGFDFQQRLSSALVLTALALLTSIHIQTKSQKKRSGQLKLAGWPILGLLLVSISWFALHSIRAREKSPAASGTRQSVPAFSSVHQQTSGANSPAVANTGGDVNINTGAQPIPDKKQKGK
jgi:hypothetical protein